MNRFIKLISGFNGYYTRPMGKKKVPVAGFANVNNKKIAQSSSTASGATFLSPAGLALCL